MTYTFANSNYSIARLLTGSDQHLSNNEPSNHSVSHSYLMLKREIRLFFTALMFYTRIPVPKWVGHSPERLNRATRYFPLIGWIVGGSMAGVIYLSQWVFPLSISVMLGLVASVLMTGAFHEDGFADVCDGFGGGWTKEQILRIMKDSRLGTYGTIGLLLLMSSKFWVLYELGQKNLFLLLVTIIASHALSRGLAATFIRKHHYVREDAESKAKPVAQRLSSVDLLIAGGFALLPLVLFPHWWLVLSIIPALLIHWYLGGYFTRWIGGYTGDCLGATQQVGELAMVLGVLALWEVW